MTHRRQCKCIWASTSYPLVSSLFGRMHWMIEQLGVILTEKWIPRWQFDGEKCRRRTASNIDIVIELWNGHTPSRFRGRVKRVVWVGYSRPERRCDGRCWWLQCSRRVHWDPGDRFFLQLQVTKVCFTKGQSLYWLTSLIRWGELALLK